MTMTFTSSQQLHSQPAHGQPAHSQPAPSAVRPRVRTHPAPTRTSALSINLLLALALGAVIIVGFVVFGGNAAANSPVQPVSPDSEIADAIEVYVVQPGDTLWAIATEVARPGEDIRPIVDQLKERTGGSALDVGQRIIIDHTTIRG